MNTQKLLPAHVPFYKKRLFWIFMHGTLILLNFLLIVSLIQNNNENLDHTAYLMLLAIGGSGLMSIVTPFIGIYHTIPLLLLNLIGLLVLGFLYYKTYWTNSKKIFYPVLVLLLLLTMYPYITILVLMSAG